MKDELIGGSDDLVGGVTYIVTLPYGRKDHKPIHPGDIVSTAWGDGFVEKIALSKHGWEVLLNEGKKGDRVWYSASAILNVVVMNGVLE